MIGPAASNAKCENCSLYHREVAKLNGATDAEIDDGVHFAKSSAGWSTYLYGMRGEKQRFADELTQVVVYVQAEATAGAAA